MCYEKEPYQAFEDDETPKSSRCQGKGKEKKKTITKRRPQRGGGFDIQKWISKLGIEFHWPGYQYIGPGTNLAKRLKGGDPGINQLDKLAK